MSVCVICDGLLVGSVTEPADYKSEDEQFSDTTPPDTNYEHAESEHRFSEDGLKAVKLQCPGSHIFCYGCITEWSKSSRDTGHIEDEEYEAEEYEDEEYEDEEYKNEEYGFTCPMCRAMTRVPQAPPHVYPPEDPRPSWAVLRPFPFLRNQRQF